MPSPARLAPRPALPEAIDLYLRPAKRIVDPAIPGRGVAPPHQIEWFCRKAAQQGTRSSPCKLTDPRKLGSAATEWKWLNSDAVGCKSGRQDSNLRPLVPQTSTYSRFGLSSM